MADRNELCIELMEGYRLRADDHNWIIEAKQPSKEGIERWKVFGYYQELGFGLKDLFTAYLRRSPAKTVQELIDYAERCQHALIRSTAPIDKWSIKKVSI